MCFCSIFFCLLCSFVDFKQKKRKVCCDQTQRFTKKKLSRDIERLMSSSAKSSFYLKVSLNTYDSSKNTLTRLHVVLDFVDEKTLPTIDQILDDIKVWDKCISFFFLIIKILCVMSQWLEKRQVDTRTLQFQSSCRFSWHGNYSYQSDRGWVSIVFLLFGIFFCFFDVFWCLFVVAFCGVEKTNWEKNTIYMSHLCILLSWNTFKLNSTEVQFVLQMANTLLDLNCDINVRLNVDSAEGPRHSFCKILFFSFYPGPPPYVFFLFCFLFLSVQRGW